MKRKNAGEGCSQSQIDSLPVLLKATRYIGESREFVGRTLPQFLRIVDSGAGLIVLGIATIGDIVEIVEFLEARRDKFPGLFPAPSARAKLTLAQKDQIRLAVLMAEKHGNNRTTINRLMSDYGVTEREVRQLARRAHGKFVEDFARRLMRTTPEDDRWRIARWLRVCCPKLEATVSESDLCKWR